MKVFPFLQTMEKERHGSRTEKTQLAVFEPGAAAEKWCEKILHPKTRMEKLGVKRNVAISLVGNFTSDFLEELQACTEHVTPGNVALLRFDQTNKRCGPDRSLRKPPPLSCEASLRFKGASPRRV